MSGFISKRVVPILKLFNGQPDPPPLEEILFDFSKNSGQVFRAKVHTDSKFGGRSRATFRVGKLGQGGGFGAVFEGMISNEHSELWKGNKATRLGFAAVTLEQIDGDEMDCENFQGLHLRIRPRDTRTYGITLRGAAPLAPGLIYQAFVRAQTPIPTEFKDIVCDFAKFMPMMGAEILEDDRELEGARFSAISIHPINAAPGPFRIELEFIKAVNDPEIANHPIYNQRLF